MTIQAAYKPEKAASMDEKFDRIMERLEKMMPTSKPESEPELYVSVDDDSREPEITNSDWFSVKLQELKQFMRETKYQPSVFNSKSDAVVVKLTPEAVESAEVTNVFEDVESDMTAENIVVLEVDVVAESGKEDFGLDVDLHSDSEKSAVIECTDMEVTSDKFSASGSSVFFFLLSKVDLGKDDEQDDLNEEIRLEASLDDLITNFSFRISDVCQKTSMDWSSYFVTNKICIKSWCSPLPLKHAPVDFISVLVLKGDEIGLKSKEFEHGTVVSRSSNFCTELVRRNVCEIFPFLLPPAKPPDECLSVLQHYNIWCWTKCWDLALSSIQQKDLQVRTATRTCASIFMMESGVLLSCLTQSNDSKVPPTEFYGKVTLDMPPYAVIDEIMSSLPASFHQGMHILGDKVERVIVFDCIVNLPCCLIIGECGWIEDREIMKAQALRGLGLDVYMSNKKITEINRENSIMDESRKIFDAEKKDKCAMDLVMLFSGSVLLQLDFNLDDLNPFENKSHQILKLGLTTEEIDDVGAEYQQDILPLEICHYNKGEKLMVHDYIALSHDDFIIRSTYQKVAGTSSSVGQFESDLSFTFPRLYRVVPDIDEEYQRLPALPEFIKEMIYKTELSGDGSMSLGDQSKPIHVSKMSLDRLKDLVMLAFQSAFLASGFSLEELVSLMCFISKIFLFSLPRPPEMDDLEYKVDFKGVGMLRNGILRNLEGYLYFGIV